MKKLIAFALSLFLMAAFCSCGEEPEQSGYMPTDIQVEKIDGSSNSFALIYDITTDKEDWSVYPEDARELQTAIDGIKECLSRDDWTETSVVYGYAGEPKLKNLLYSYGSDGSDGDYTSIKVYQYGIYNTTFTVTDELQ